MRTMSTFAWASTDVAGMGERLTQDKAQMGWGPRLQQLPSTPTPYRRLLGAGREGHGGKANQQAEAPLDVWLICCCGGLCSLHKTERGVRQLHAAQEEPGCGFGGLKAVLAWLSPHSWPAFVSYGYSRPASVALRDESQIPSSSR